MIKLLMIKVQANSETRNMVAMLLVFTLISHKIWANEVNVSGSVSKPHNDISHLVSKEQFLSYANVADFIDDSPKVTITTTASQQDIDDYGQGVVKTLTGSDCDRDGIMDDNTRCNAIYVKLWLKYQR